MARGAITFNIHSILLQKSDSDMNAVVLANHTLIANGQETDLRSISLGATPARGFFLTTRMVSSPATMS
jgi:hypothetical protein